jgi:hypothetical protein
MRLLAAAVVASLTFAPSLAEAQSAADCGGIELSAIGECHFEVEGGCKANCEPLNFTAACDGQCNVSINASCSSSCEGSCQAECDVDPGSFDCTASCESDCQGTIQAQCGTDQECVSYCEADCSTQCESECNVVPPSADCTAQCEGCCSGSCEFDANASCSFDCQAELKGGCEVDCDAPEGALYCDGQYIAVQNLPACVEYLVSNFSVSLELSASAEGSFESSGCSIAGVERTGFGLGLFAAISGLAFARRRRRRT